MGTDSLLAFALGACATLAGCGGNRGPQPAAEPAQSPPVQARPAGEVRYLAPASEGMVFDRRSDSLAVGIREPYRLAFVDPGSLGIKRETDIPSPARHLSLSPDGRRVVVPSEFANAILEISPRSGPPVIQAGTGGHPHDAASADGKIFVANEFSDNVSVIRGSRDIATLPAPAQPGGIAAIGNRYVVLVAVSERVLQVYDARTNKVLGKTPAGTGPTHIVTAGNYGYVADTEGGLLRKFRIGSRPRQVATAPASGAPYGIAVDRRRGRIWVTLTAKNRLDGYSIRGPGMHRFASYPTIRQANSVAVDPGTGKIFVVSRETGRIERINPKVKAG